MPYNIFPGINLDRDFRPSLKHGASEDPLEVSSNALIRCRGKDHQSPDCRPLVYISPRRVLGISKSLSLKFAKRSDRSRATP